MVIIILMSFPALYLPAVKSLHHYTIVKAYMIIFFFFSGPLVLHNKYTCFLDREML